MNKNKNTEKESTNEPEKQIIEHMPYLSLILEDVRELNRSLREGKDAVPETQNLITDLPMNWRSDILEDIKAVTEDYNYTLKYNNQFLRLGYHTRESVRELARKKICSAGQDYARKVKQLVISELDAKGILLMTKKALSGKTFRIDAGDSDDEQ